MLSLSFFFFRRTNKGGKNSGGNVTHLKSKLVPIGRLVQRQMMWVCKLVPENFFDDNFVLLEQQMDDDKHDIMTSTNNDIDDIILDINNLE